jgi:hypothetical protein
VTAHDLPRARGTIRRGRRRIAALAAVAIAAEITVALTGAAHADGRTVAYQCGRGPVEVHYPVASVSPATAGTSATVRSTLQLELPELELAGSRVTGLDVDVPFPQVTDDRMIRSFAGADATGGNLTLARASATDSIVHLSFTGNAPAAAIEVPTFTVDILIEAYYFSHGAAAVATSIVPDFTVRTDTGSLTCAASGPALGQTRFDPPRGTVVPTVGPTWRPTITMPTTSSTTTTTTTTVPRTIPPKTTPPGCHRQPQWLWHLLMRLWGVIC